MAWMEISPGHDGFSVKNKVIADVEMDNLDPDSPYIVRIIGKVCGRAKTQAGGQTIIEYQLLQLCRDITNELKKIHR